LLIAAIRKHSKGTQLECILLMALGTGMRQGELLGLRWKDIDYNLQELKVERTLKYINVINEDRSRDFKCVIQPPKSKTSKRTIPIPAPLIPVLKAHRKSQLQDKLKAGSSYIKSDFIFTTEMGNTIDSRTLARAYKRFLNRADITYIKFHSLRHTYTTKLFEANVPLKTIQTLLV